ncbi:MAG: DUF1800 domain-containing protein [Actinomycetia bacterium]|nr:DUF1800 domain-containing protein [Actinomycetes bacterium]
MDERDSVKWLHRRAGFGLPPAQMRAAIESGFAGELDRLLDPSAVAAAGAADPWDDESLPYDPMDAPSRRYAIGRWIDAMVATEQPLVDRMTWLWHGHFVSAIDKVRVARLMVDQIRLLRSAGLGDLRNLVRSLTIDAAMLIYLDLRTSTDEVPNENYSRELLELFTLGEGNYSEDDVQAGAAALSGWNFDRGGGEVVFRERRHDDQLQTYLGVDGVHDLDTVIDAVMAHPALPTFIASTICEELLGESDPELVAELASGFAASGFAVSDLVRAALTAGAEREAAPLVLGPLPWLVIAARTTAARVEIPQAALLLRVAGQLPMLPPNVAGWPGGAAWFNAGSLVARANLAALVAADATDVDVLAAAEGDDPAALADALGLPSAGFDEQSRAALSAAPAGRDRLAIALLTPEFMIA